MTQESDTWHIHVDSVLLTMVVLSVYSKKQRSDMPGYYDVEQSASLPQARQLT